MFQEGTPLLKLQRKNDSLLIKDFIGAGFRDNELAELNRFRMFLQVSFLSYITTGGGLIISKTSCKGGHDLKTQHYT